MYIFIQKHLQYKIIVSLKGEFYDINTEKNKKIVGKSTLFPDSCKFLVTSNNFPTEDLCLVKLSSFREA